MRFLLDITRKDLMEILAMVMCIVVKERGIADPMGNSIVTFHVFMNVLLQLELRSIVASD
jgi:hypothetical protein